MTTKISRLVKQNRSVLYHASLTREQVKKLEEHFYRTPKRDRRNARCALPDKMAELQKHLVSMFGHLPEVSTVESTSIIDTEVFALNMFCLVVVFRTFNLEKGLLTTFIVHAGYS